MDTGDRIEAMTGQMDQVQDQAKWAFGFAFTSTVLALQGADPIDVLGLSLSRIQAFFVIAGLYLASCLAALTHIRRLDVLLSGLPASEVPSALAKLSLHRWILNPLALEASMPGKRAQGAWGWAGLVCVFWLCMVCLYCLLPAIAFRSPLAVIFEQGLFSPAGWLKAAILLGYLAPVGMFAAVGAMALDAVPAMLERSAGRVPAEQADLKSSLLRHAVDLKLAGDVGIGIGGLLLLGVLLLKYGMG